VLRPKMAANVQLIAGGQIKTFVLSTVIKINKEPQTSMTHSPARLQ
jgi:ribosome-associated protein YbcJ (S4-like RNA binding protein)